MRAITNPNDHDRIMFAAGFIKEEGRWVVERVEKGWLVRAVLKPDGTIEVKRMKKCA